MSWILLVLGAVGALISLHALRPARWPAFAILPSWGASWLVAELPVHHLVIQAFVAAGLVALGALDAWPGPLGLGLLTLGWLGLVKQVGLARQVPSLVDAALIEGFGEAGPNARPVGGLPGFLTKAAALPLRSRGVERLKGITYAQVAGRKLNLDVWRPKASGTGRPVLLYVHGGGWVVGHKAQQGRVTLDRLARAGWVCVSIDYRLSPRATFPEHLQDVRAAIAWVHAHAAEYGGDPDFVVAAGASAGAHLVALAALAPEESAWGDGLSAHDTRLSGCVLYYGVYDLCDRFGHWPHGGLGTVWERCVLKRLRSQAPEDYERASPITHTTPEAPPMMLLHGDADTLAPVEESRRFAEALRRDSRAPVVYLELPGAPHAFELFPSLRSVPAIEGVAAFCQRLWLRHQQGASSRATPAELIQG